MRGFIVGTIATAITFAIVSYLLPQIDYGGQIPTLIVVALIAGVVNGLIKPIIKLFSLPLTMMTFGLFGLVINAGLLLLVAWLSSFLGFSFTVGGFPDSDFSFDTLVAALIGGIAISIVGAVVNMAVPDPR
jgi:putative membrane protein